VGALNVTSSQIMTKRRHLTVARFSQREYRKVAFSDPNLSAATHLKITLLYLLADLSLEIVFVLYLTDWFYTRYMLYMTTNGALIKQPDN